MFTLTFSCGTTRNHATPAWRRCRRAASRFREGLLRRRGAHHPKDQGEEQHALREQPGKGGDRARRALGADRAVAAKEAAEHEHAAAEGRQRRERGLLPKLRPAELPAGRPDARSA